MRITKLNIRNFRGIRSASLVFSKHAVLLGDNNIGKSTIFESLDLVLGPDRLNKRPIIDEHDFYNGIYKESSSDQRAAIYIEVIITELNGDQRRHFYDVIEWWCQDKQELVSEVDKVDKASTLEALRVCFKGYYDKEDDDFTGATYFAGSLTDSDTSHPFKKKDKQKCGFLYLRSIRTGSRALSLERGTLLDIILRIKEIRPQMWENTIAELSRHNVASEPELGISGILETIENSIKKFVPKEWGTAPRLKISKLTREHLRKIITVFVDSGNNTHSLPFYYQGTGTINILVLAMLSMIAEDKQNVIFAMEEPETAIPPYAQKRIVHEVQQLSTQTFFTSHSPYVIEEFDLDETVILPKDHNGELCQAQVKLPSSIRHKRYRQEFRTRFCEGLLSRKILIAEGATEATAIPVVARRLFELDSNIYASLEMLGLCIIDAGGDTSIPDIANFYKKLGKQVFALCDKQPPENQARIEQAVDKLFMHDEEGIEDLVLKNTTSDAIDRFSKTLEWPPHLQSQYSGVEKRASTAALRDYFKWSKGNCGVADFLAQCMQDEIPNWIKETCKKIKEICERENLITNS